MELKVPPVVVFLLSVGLIFGIHYGWPQFSYSWAYADFISSLLFILGALSGAGGVLTFRRHGTTVDPTRPDKASRLVTSGVYRYTRNPMYLGMAWLLVGAVLRLGNPFGFLALIFFLGYMTQFQIKPEERALEQCFGKVYLDYRSRVRRWI